MKFVAGSNKGNKRAMRGYEKRRAASANGNPEICQTSKISHAQSQFRLDKRNGFLLHCKHSDSEKWTNIMLFLAQGHALDEMRYPHLNVSQLSVCAPTQGYKNPKLSAHGRTLHAQAH